MIGRCLIGGKGIAREDQAVTHFPYSMRPLIFSENFKRHKRVRILETLRRQVETSFGSWNSTAVLRKSAA